MHRRCILNENIYRRNFLLRQKCDAAHDSVFFKANQAAILHSSSLAACLGCCPPFSAKPVRPGIKIAESMGSDSIDFAKKNTGRVENRLTPALPHQTVHALLTHTAFRCPSHQGMRCFPASLCRNLV